MPTGIIIFYRAEKRQGYLRLSDTLEDFFFQLPATQTGHGLVKGARVNFTLVQDRKGIRAENIRPLLFA